MAKIQKTINTRTKYYLENVTLEIVEDDTSSGIITYVHIGVTGERSIQLTYKDYLNLVTIIKEEQGQEF